MKSASNESCEGRGEPLAKTTMSHHVRRASFYALSLVALLATGCDVGSQERQPRDVDALIERAEIQVERGRFDAAIEALSEAAVLAPDNAEVFTERGMVYEKLERWDDAESDYGRAIAANAADARAYNNRAALRAKSGRFAAAIDDLTQAIEKDPEDLLARQNRSLAYFDLGRFDESISDLTAAEKLDPFNSVNAFRRGRAERALGQPDKAIASLTKALELSERDGSSEADWIVIRSERAAAFGDIGREQEALEDLRKIAELDPNSSAAAELRDELTIEAVIAQLKEAGYQLSEAEAIGGFDLMAARDEVPVPVLIVRTDFDEEFTVSGEELAVLDANVHAVVAVEDTSSGRIFLHTVASLDAADIQPTEFVIRPGARDRSAE